MRIHLYTICWNEIQLLPYFLRHYQEICDKIFVYDNGSDDGTQDLVAEHPLCELRHIDSQGQYHEGALLKVKGQFWKESRRTADWVICCDIDELLFHPHLLTYLRECQERGVTIPTPAGWQLLNSRFPTGGDQIYSEIKTGFPDPFYAKRIIFNPSAIDEMNYTPGCHSAAPVGNVIEHADPLLKLLHCKYLGLEYVTQRNALLAARLSEFNRARGFGHQYLTAPERLAEQFNIWQSTIQPIKFTEEE